MTTATASPSGHLVSGTARQSMRKALLACGVLASLLYAVTNIVGALRWEGYSSASQTVSELFAIGAPSRAFLVPFALAYDVLIVAFGIGVWQCADRRRGLRIAACLLIVGGAIGPFWPPMHLRGDPVSLTDTLHVVFAGVVVLFNLLTIAFAATAFGVRFRLYSLVTLGVLLAFGALTARDGPRIPANLPTPWVGLYERINIAAYLLWIAVTAIALLRAESERPGRGLGSEPPHPERPTGTRRLSATV